MSFFKLPKNQMGQTSRMWCLNTLSNIVGTVIGIILTFGVTFWIEYRNTQKDNKKATFIVLENILMITKECKESYNRILESKPKLEEILELTPDRVMTMPEDSVLYFASAFPPSLHVYQDYARNLLNNNFEILRSTDNYLFLQNVHYFYSIYDRLKDLYEKEGPDRLLTEINDVLREEEIKQRRLDNSTRLELLEISKSVKIKLYIQAYLEHFIPYLDIYMEWLMDGANLVGRSCEYKADEFDEFFEKQVN